MTRSSIEFGKWFGELRAIMELPAKPQEAIIYWLCKCKCSNFAIVSDEALLSGKHIDCSCNGTAKPLELIKPKERFGQLTLISFTGRLDEQNDTLWLLRCDCNAFHELPLRSLKDTKTDCCVTEHKQRHRFDLTGKKFPLFTVISYTGKSKKNSPVWLCECECGRFFEASTSKIKAGRIRSCGCYRKALFKSDSEVSWFQEGTNLNAYGKLIKSNTSGVTGVQHISDRDRWYARLIFKGELVLNKTFPTFKEAVDARMKAERIYIRPLLIKYGLIPDDD